MRRIITSFLSTLVVMLAGFTAFIAYASSNNAANTIGRTPKTTTVDANSCGGCHSNKDTGISVTITGPNQLYAGDYGNYQIVVTKSTTAQNRIGIDVAASDTASALTVTGGEATTTALYGGVAEVTHLSGGTLSNLAHLVSGTGSYHFRYTMPASAAASSTHGLYGVAVLGATGTSGASTTAGWNFGSTSGFTVTTKALPAAPATLSAGTPASSSVPLSWSAAGPQYRVLAKTGTFSSSASDGAIVYEGSGTSVTATGLNASTGYYFSAYSKDVGADSGNSFFSTTAAQTTATTGMSLEPNPWVDAVAGNDSTNAGTYDAPLKTITKALTAVGGGGTIHVRPGTYNTSLGETFPIVVPSGIKLQSTTGAASTIIDATGANKRVIELNGTNSSTLVEGFTITGGLFRGAADGSNSVGGGIRAYNNDQSTISRCIIKGNTVAGYNGVSVTYLSGGNAYGGGIDIDGTTKVINCVISNNTAAGGNGYSFLGTGNPGAGYSGGNGQGGGAHSFTGAATFFNDTFYGNAATGGNGGSAFSTGGTYAGGAGGNGSYGGMDATNAVSTNCIFANSTQTAGTGGSGAGGGANGGNGTTTGGIVQSASSTYDLFFNNAGGNGTTGTFAITGQDPLFVNAPSDLHVRSSSPAKFAGTATGAPSVDLENKLRPNPPTIGAYEIGISLTVTGGIGRITVNWAGVDGASSYNLYMSTSSPVTTGSTKVSGATSPHVVAPLANSTTMFFAVAAIENGIEGPLSPQASGTTSAGSGGPWVSAALSGTGFTNITRDLSDGKKLWATTTDSVGLYTSSDAGDTWSAVTGPFNGTSMRAVVANGSTVVVAGAGNIYRSTNGGSTWATVVSGGGIGETIEGMAIDPLSTNTIYAGDFHIDFGSTSSYVGAKSADGGASFHNFTDASAQDLRAYYWQVDPQISGTVYAAGSGAPNIAKSTNNGSTWSSVSPVGGYPQSLAIAPSSSSTLYAGMRNVSNSNSLGVYKTVNGGTSWNQMNTGFNVTLPDVSALLVDPSDANHVHAGTTDGYYVTTNGGTNWSAGASGAGSHFINALVQTSNRRLIATTTNSLIIMLPLDAAPAINANANPGTGSSAGGDRVTISGTGFNATSGLRVLFGGVDAIVDLGTSNSTTITVTTPAHAAGNVDVAVINPDGQAAIRTNGYTYIVCSFSLNPTSASYTSATATGSVTVTVNSGCSWTATAPGGSFVSITSGSSGNGNGTVQYSVASNATGSSRSTTLTVAGMSFPIDQSAFGGGSFTLTATASNGSVSLSWASAGGASSYSVMRSSGGGFGTIVPSTGSLNYTDSAVVNGTGYLYRIHANTGADSNVDLAVPMAYTDASLSAGTFIKAVHFTQLRTAVNAARTALGLANLTFTDGTLNSSIAVKRIHLIELRNGVDGVRAALGLSALSYTDPSVTAGSTTVKAAHILELRGGLQ